MQRRRDGKRNRDRQADRTGTNEGRLTPHSGCLLPLRIPISSLRLLDMQDPQIQLVARIAEQRKSLSFRTSFNSVGYSVAFQYYSDSSKIIILSALTYKLKSIIREKVADITHFKLMIYKTKSLYYFEMMDDLSKQKKEKKNMT